MLPRMGTLEIFYLQLETQKMKKQVQLNYSQEKVQVALEEIFLSGLDLT